MTTLREAAQQALEALETLVPRRGGDEYSRAAAALRAALAQQDEQDHNTRAEFERWAASYSTFCLEREDDAALGTAGYKSVEQTMLWHAWQAAKTNAPVGASGGKSGANTRLGLAGADCTHEFAVAATSGISICTKCGLSEMVARKRALRAALAQQDPEFLVTNCTLWGSPPKPHEYWSEFFSAMVETRTLAGVFISDAALAQQAEPVAWIDIEEDGTRHCLRSWSDGTHREHALCAAPPQRKWQGLTEEEIQSIHDTYHKRMGPQEFARAIEAALKEKNA